MSGLLLAAGCVVIGFVGGLIGRKFIRNGQAITPESFDFRFGEVEAEGLKEQLLTETRDNSV